MIESAGRGSEAEQSRRQYRGKVAEMLHMEQRITLRLGQDDEVTKEYRVAGSAASWLLNAFDPEMPGGAMDTKQGSPGGGLSQSQDRFLEAARSYVGSRFRDNRRGFLTLLRR
jgi:hypothetical protein